MRKIFAGLMTAAFIVSFGAPAFAKTETITGKVVDQSCYMKDKANNTGVDHKMPTDTKDCAIACAKKGRPMAILTDDGKVYTIAGGLAAENNAKLVPHISHTVAVTGDVMKNKDGSMMIHGTSLKMLKKS
jgi:hypothetical protein